MTNGDPNRMTAAEYREMMGLDKDSGAQPPTVKKTTIKKEDKPVTGNDFHRAMSRITLRMIWLIGWGWLIFTFGWIGHVLIRLAERGLNATATKQDV